tara:strand:+ start:7014 stop:7493 length:480 start_codon:yes stop_codon:yes gene_type:complete
MENEEFDFVGEFNKLKENYDLPKFEELSRDFDIEKILEKKPNFLLRDIRMAMNEKLSGYLNLFEVLINPNSPPMFIFSILRNVDDEKMEDIKKIYKKLSKLQIKTMKLDTIYDENSEANYIRNSFDEWNELKETIYKVIESFEESFEQNNSSRKSGYLA